MKKNRLFVYIISFLLICYSMCVPAYALSISELSQILPDKINVSGKEILTSCNNPGNKYRINSNGERYGSVAYFSDDFLDLFYIVAQNGRTGYVRKTNLYGNTPKTPAEALSMPKDSARSISIPVYLEDGITVIGEFIINAETIEENNNNQIINFNNSQKALMWPPPNTTVIISDNSYVYMPDGTTYICHNELEAPNSSPKKITFRTAIGKSNSAVILPAYVGVKARLLNLDGSIAYESSFVYNPIQTTYYVKAVTINVSSGIYISHGLTREYVDSQGIYWTHDTFGTNPYFGAVQ